MEIGLPDGSTAKISSLPDFATEATQKRMLAQIRAMAKNNDKHKEALDSLVTHAAGAAKADAKAAEEQKKATKEIAKEIGTGLKGLRTRFADRIEADTQQVFGFATMALGKLATAAVAATGFMVGLAKATAAYAEDTGRQLDAVTAAGAGFGDSFGGSMSGVINGMRGYGLTLEQSAGLMSEFSRATQTVGKYRIPALSGQFLALTRNGKELGLTIYEASRAMMDELQQRSELYDVSQMDSRTLSMSVARSIKLQNQYAGALGMSVDQLRKSVAAQVKGNDYILASSLKFGPQFTQNMADFATVLKGSAGDSIAPVSDAIMSLIAAPESQITEQGQAIRMFGSQLAGVGVDLNGFINKYQQQVLATGQFDGQAVGEELLGIFRAAIGKGADLSTILSQAKAAGLNPEMIQSLTQSLVNLQTSANTTAKDLKPDPFQEQVNSMRNTMNALNAVLDGAKQNLFGAAYKDMQAIIEGITLLIEPLSQAFVEIVRALTGTGAGESLKDSIKSFGPTIREAGTTIANFIRGIRETFDKFKGEDGKINWAGFIGQMVTDAIWGAFSLAGDIIAAAAGAIWENPKILGAILAGLGTLFAIAAAKAAAGAVVGGLTDKIRDRVSGRAAAAATQSAPAGRAGRGATATMGESFGKSLSGIGKGIGDFAKNVGKGAGALLTSVGTGIGNLGTGLAKFGAAAGRGIGQAIAGIMTGLATGATALGTAVATGVGALGLAAFAGIILAIGGALRLAAPFMKEAAPVLMKLIEVVGQVAMGGLKEIGETIRAIADVIGNVLISAIREVPNIIRAVGDGIKSVFDGVSGLVTSMGTQIQGIINSVASGISQVISTMRGAQDEAMLIKAQTDSVKELSNIQPGNISAVAGAIKQLAAALSAFGDASGGTWNEMIKGAMGGGRTNAIAAQIELFNQFGTLNTQALLAGASAITKLTESLNKFTEIDVKKMTSVNESIHAMTRANDATIKTMERVAKLDGKVIAENARAIMIYNGAAQGEIIVPPTPAAGADLSSFYQAIVRALNGGTPVSQANLNPNRDSGSQPETLQQQMVRLLSTIESNTATANRKLDEVTKAVR